MHLVTLHKIASHSANCALFLPLWRERVMLAKSQHSWQTRTTLMHMTCETFAALKIYIQLWSEHLCRKEEGFHRHLMYECFFVLKRKRSFPYHSLSTCSFWLKSQQFVIVRRVCLDWYVFIINYSLHGIKEGRTGACWGPLWLPLFHTLHIDISGSALCAIEIRYTRDGKSPITHNTEPENSLLLMTSPV